MRHAGEGGLWGRRAAEEGIDEAAYGSILRLGKGGETFGGLPLLHNRGDAVGIGGGGNGDKDVIECALLQPFVPGRAKFLGLALELMVVAPRLAEGLRKGGLWRGAEE